MTKRTHGARAVVTGAGSGIGRAFAHELARRGGRIVCADIDEAAAEHTAKEINAKEIDTACDTAVAYRCDVASEEQVARLARAAPELLGAPVDLVVNNAGVGAGGEVLGADSLADWRRTVEVNLWGVVHGCHAFTPGLRALGRGGIVNVASAASFAAAPRMGAYNASKAGVLALSETLAAELAGSGVTVSVLCPTFVQTAIAAGPAITADAAALAERLMRWSGVSPESVARTTLDAHDRGRLHVLPQWDARLLWRLKRLAPGPYTLVAGSIHRLADALGGTR